MSDDFDDLSWLKNDDEEPGEDKEEDKEEFDWQQPAGKPATPPSGHLGFTGELPWMQDDDDPDAETGGDGEAYEWSQQAAGDEPAIPSDDDFDVGWLNQPPQEPTVRSSQEVPKWVSETTELPPDDPHAAWKDATPGWLRGESSEPPPAPAPQAADINDVPDWLSGTGPSAAAEDVDINDVPDWLRGADEPARPPATMLDDTGELSSDWLATGSALPDTASSEKTFDQWMVEQAALEREPDLEEQMPDLTDLGTPGSVPTTDTGALPDWFLGMEEMDQSDVPDWFADNRPPTGDLADSPINDWLAAQAPPPPPPPVEPPKPAGMLDDDFFSSMGQQPAEDDLLGEDFFASMGSTGGDSSLDDIFASLGDSSPAEPAPPGGMLNDDFFASLGGETQFDAITDSEMFDDEQMDEDFFAALNQQGQEPEPELDALGDDFMASLGIDTDSKPPAGRSELDAEFLSALERADSGVDLEDVDQYFATQEPAAFNVDTVPDGQLLQSLGIEDDQPAAGEFDWFALEDQPQDEMPEAENWLDNLGDLDESSLMPEMPLESEIDYDEDPLPAVEAPGLDDIDTLLGTMGGDLMTLPDTGNLLDSDMDFDSLFADPAFSDIAAPERETNADTLPDAPDWLTEAGATVGGVSAAAMLRQRDDRPLDELPDRLKRLRDRGAAATARADEPDALAGFSPDMAEVSDTAAPLITGTGAAVVLTPDQQQRLDLLRTLTASEHAGAIAAARSVSDEPFLLDEDERAPEVAAPAEWATPKRRMRVKIDRLLIALLVAAAVIVPFVSGVRFGDLPPSTFAAGSRQQAVFDSLNSVQPGDRVLVGMEYGPTAAPELDSTARLLLQHILLRGAQPVVVSTNPVALLRVDNLLAELVGESGWQPFGKYYVTRYLTGGPVGLRAFSEAPAAVVATDLHGQPNGLIVNSFADFARVVIIAERPDDLRAWAEQIAPMTDAPLLAVTGYAGEPLIEPYVGDHASIAGLLVGFKDAYTYSQMLAAAPAQVIIPTEDVEPTEEGIDSTPLAPTEAITEAAPTEEIESPLPAIGMGVIEADQNINVRSGPAANAAIVTGIAPGTEVSILDLTGDWTNIRLADGTEGWVAAELVQVTDATGATQEPTEAPTLAPPTNTPAPTETDAPEASPTTAPTEIVAPTATSVPSATPVPSSTPPPTATSVPSATPVTEVVARIISSETINVRSGPNTTFAPVGTANPGDEFPVIGRNSDGTWIQIDYPDLLSGQEAWVASFLVEITSVEVRIAPEPDRLLLVMAGSDMSIGHLLAQDEPTEEATAEAEAESTEAVEATSEAAPAEATIVSVQAIPYAEQRWSAMNLGLAVIIVVILFGTLVNIARALLRRGK
jgi:uncharacterized protein YgiM (DUF1202 family)